MKNLKRVSTDVLVIGGGMAGCFAAVKAKEQGADVLLVDKAYVGSSGQTPFANTLFVFDPKTDDHAAWMRQIAAGGDYLCNQAWAEIVFQGSMSVFEDLTDFGVEFLKNEDGTWLKKGMDELGPCTCVFPNEAKTPHAVKLREKVLATGCVIMDRIMIAELLKVGNRVSGAVGFAVSGAEPYLFEAKTVILCAGACGFKPPGWPISNLTADGDMMAYRAGAEITGKEFVDVHTVSPDSPAYVGPSFLKRPPGFTPPLPKYMTGDGDVKRMLRFHLGPEFDVHKGLAPIYGRYLAETPPPDADWPAEMITGSSMGMSAHRCEGIWPEGYDCSTQMEGLYAAGDSLGIMLCGAAYSALGIALSGCGVTGTIAGKAAAGYARSTERGSVSETETAAILGKIFEPLNKKTGFKPAWVIQLLQNLMTPYFISFIKSEDRLLSALTQVEFYRDHLIPRLRAGDAHELRLAIEVRNMVGNAEMRLRASLMRRESRGTHYREDYPERDDDHWYRWIKIRQTDGKMYLTTVCVPEEWRKPEGEPYFYEFPSFSNGE